MGVPGRTCRNFPPCKSILFMTVEYPRAAKDIDGQRCGGAAKQYLGSETVVKSVMLYCLSVSSSVLFRAFYRLLHRLACSFVPLLKDRGYFKVVMNEDLDVLRKTAVPLFIYASL